MHVGKEVGLLVVLGVHRVQSALAHHEHDALALVTQFLEVDAPSVLAQHVVLLKQGGHLVQCLTIYDVVVHFLIISQRTFIHADVTNLHVSTVATQGNPLGCVLHEVVAIAVDVGGAPRAVHVEFHQPAVGTLANHKGNLLPFVLSVLSANANGLGGLVPVLILHFLRRAGVHHRLISRYLEAFRSVQAAQHR